MNVIWLSERDYVLADAYAEAADPLADALRGEPCAILSTLGRGQFVAQERDGHPLRLARHAWGFGAH